MRHFLPTLRLRALLSLSAMVAAASPTAVAQPPSATTSTSAEAIDAAFGATSFSTPAAALYKAGHAIKGRPEQGGEVLLVDVQVSFDAQGRKTTKRRMISRVNTEAGVESWGEVQASYTPVREHPVEIRARVINGGKEAWLDAKALTVEKQTTEGNGVYASRHTLMGPLPGVVKGSVVEEEHTWVDAEPFIAGAGDFSLQYAQNHAEWMRLTVKHHKSTPVRVRFAGRLRRFKDIAGDVVTQTFVQKRKPTDDGYVDRRMLPPWAVQFEGVAISTGASWAQVASAYSKVVDEKVAADQALDARAKAWAAGATSRKAIAEAVLQRNHDDVRYASVALGAGSVVPRVPQQTVTSGYGDCKDKSTLLVGVLRSLGVDAHVALLKAGTDGDLLPQMPGMGAFNHAIVYVAPDEASGEPGFFMDPTAPGVPFGELPLADMNRWALIASSTTTALVKTPAPSLDDTRTELMSKATVPLVHYGAVDESEVVQGLAAQGMRLDEYTKGRHFALLRDVKERHSLKGAGPFYPSMSEEAKAKAIEKAKPKQAYTVDTPLIDHVTFKELPRDAQGRVTTTIHVPRSKRSGGDANSGFAVVYPSQLVSELPFMLRRTEDNIDDDERKAMQSRKLPYHVTSPINMRQTTKVVMDPIFAVDVKDKRIRKKVAGVSFDVDMGLDTTGAWVLSAEVKMPAGSYTPQQWAQLRAMVQEVTEAMPYQVQPQSKAHALLAQGDLSGAIKLATAGRGKTLSSEELRLLGSLLLNANMVDAARTYARMATVKAPNDRGAWIFLVITLLYGTYGEDMGPGWRRDEALEAFEKVFAFDTSDVQPLRDSYASALGFAGANQLSQNKDDWDKALAQLKKVDVKVLDAEDRVDHDNLLGTFLLLTRDYKALAKHVEGMQEGPVRHVADVVSTSGLHGTEEGLKKLRKLYPNPKERIQFVASVTVDFVRAGQEDIVVTEFDESALYAEQPGALMQIADALRGTPVKPALWADDVKSFGEQTVFELFFPYGDMDAAFERMWMQTGVSDNLHKTLVKVRRMTATRTTPAMWKTVYGSLKTKVSGDDDKGYVVKVDIGGRAKLELFVTREKDKSLRWLFIGKREEETGLPALKMVLDGRIEEARHLLTAMKAADPKRNTSDWPDLEKATPDALAFLAASLSRVTRPEMAPMLFEVGLRPIPSSEVVSADVVAQAKMHTLMFVSKNKKPSVSKRQLRALRTDLVALSKEMKDEKLAHMRQQFIDRLVAEAHGDVKKRLKLIDHIVAADSEKVHKEKGEDKEKAERLLRMHRREQAEVHASVGDYDKSIKLLRDLIDETGGTSGELNSLAWAMLYTDKVDADEAVRVGKRASVKSKFKSWPVLHTLAMALADAGRGAEALALCGKLHKMSGNDDEGIIAMVQGRVAQKLGLLDAAAIYYAQVKPEKDGPFPNRNSSVVLLDKYLKEDKGLSRKVERARKALSTSTSKGKTSSQKGKRSRRKVK